MSLDTDPATTVLQATREVLALHSERPLNPHHAFDELHCDSLHRIAIATAIERLTGQAIPDHVLANARTIGELIDHIAGGVTS